MSEDKEYIELDSVITTLKGFAFKSEDYIESGTPVIRVSDFTENSISLSENVYFPKERAIQYSKYQLTYGDILIQTVGSWPSNPASVVGKVVRVPIELIGSLLNQNIVKIIPKKSIEKKFLFYLLKDETFKNYIVNCAQGAASQASITLDAIKKFKFILPDISIQHRIATILSAYDNLIENNNRRIALLEQMAEQIYKEWYVRMRFPGYENTEFEKGVPKGWEVKSIKDFGKVVTGKTPSTSNAGYFGGKYPFIKTPDMHGNIFVLQTEETLTEDGFNSQKSQALPANSICVNCIGAGAGSVSITPSNSMTNQQIHTLILKNQKELEFMFFVLRGLKPMIEMVGSTGATMINVSKGKFENLKLIKPSDNLIEDFSSKTKPVFLQIRNLMEQQIKIKQTRDLLLPRLISGKLRVKEMEKTV